MGKNVRGSKFIQKIFSDNVSSNKNLKHAAIELLLCSLSHQRKKEDIMGGSGIPGTKFSLPEIRGIFQMFQSRLKGCVCRAGMATMLIGGEFRMRGGYSTGTNAELNI